ncbi:MAG: hypothetical protein ACOYEL_06875 [Saccharofermentanales bacterium]|jgi:hypothetical protein
MDILSNDSEKSLLNSKDMEEKLKGDAFPDSWNEFLNDDIRLFFDALLEQTGQRKSDVIRKANLPRTYGYQIMEGRRLAKRDYYLCLALAMSLDLKTTQRMLAVTRSGGLHPLIKRDAALMFAINHGYSFEKTYDFMCQLELPPLDTGLADK